jgi:hypothetical protein
MTPVFERAKIGHTLDRVATVIGLFVFTALKTHTISCDLKNEYNHGIIGPFVRG